MAYDSEGDENVVFANNIMDETRALCIEASRDVSVLGNKFTNGRITTNDWDEARRGRPRPA